MIVLQISQLESALSQEQAMHIVARTQLSSLEDDNQRLRTQLNNIRKRYTHGAAEERSDITLLSKECYQNKI